MTIFLSNNHKVLWKASHNSFTQLNNFEIGFQFCCHVHVVAKDYLSVSHPKMNLPTFSLHRSPSMVELKLFDKKSQHVNFFWNGYPCGDSVGVTLMWRL